MRAVVVGVGNPILGDDGVGIHVARIIDGRIDADVKEAYTGGLNLLDMIIGYDQAILVDAVYIEEMEIGDVRIMELDELGSAHSSNPHDATLMEAIEMARKMGEERIPDSIKLVGIKIERVEEFGEDISEKVEGSIEKAVKMIEGMILKRKD